MAKTEENKRQEAAVEKQPVVIPYQINKEEKIVCPVCGHANEEYAAICKMCSNYLRG